MDTTNTSPKASTDFALRLRLWRDGKAAKDGAVYPLFERKTHVNEIDYADDACVREDGQYVLDLLSKYDLGRAEVLLTLDGQTYVKPTVSAMKEVIEYGGEQYYWYYCSFGQDERRLFQMVLGFATIEVDIRAELGETFDLRTRDIPCLCEKEDQERSISSIIDALIESQNDEVMQWMLYPQRLSEERQSLLDGKVFDSSQSIRSFVGLVESILSGYEQELPFFRSLPHGRTEQHREVVDGRRARQIRGGELLWLAKNTHVLRSVPSGAGMMVAGRSVVPRAVQTSVVKRCFDNPENRSVLAFLNEVVSGVTEVEAKAFEAVRRLRLIEERLGTVNQGGGILLPLAIVRACIAAEAPQVERLKEVRQRGLRLLRAYRQALPDVAITPYRLPRRTKVFQEVRQYLRIYQLMEKWQRFGRFDMVRDGLLLSIRRMDKLYEYYVLFELLSAFNVAGYQLDYSLREPLALVAYSLDDSYFSNELAVTNRYSLRKGDTRVLLFYQPVLYGDMREENGIYLHRSTPRYPFAGTEADSYWTPDFLVIRERTGMKRDAIILDAKFRTISSVTRSYEGASAFTKCLVKYKDAVDASDGGEVSAVWLLCGRGERSSVMPYQSSSWARLQESALPDGVASVSPDANGLRDLFEILGFSGNMSEEGDGLLGTINEAASAIQKKAAQNVAGQENGDGLHWRDVLEGVAVDAAASKVDKASEPVDHSFSGGRKERDSANSKLELKEHEKKGPIEVDRPAAAPVKTDSSKKKQEIAPDVLKAIREVCELTVDKGSLADSRSSANQLGFSHPLLRAVAPMGRERKFYTSEPIEVDGHEVYVYRQWKPINIVKLRALQKQLKKG